MYYRYSQIVQQPIVKKENKSYIEFIKEHNLLTSTTFIYKIDDNDLVPTMVLENNQKYSMQIDKGKHRFFVSDKNRNYNSSIIEVDIKDNKTYYIDLNPRNKTILMNKTLLILNDENIKVALDELNKKGCTQDVLDKFEFFEINPIGNHNLADQYNNTFNNINTYNSYTTPLEITCVIIIVN